MRINLTQGGLLKQGALEAWTRKKQKAIRDAVGSGTEDVRKHIKQDVQALAASKFRVRRKGFINSFTARIFNRKRNRLPALFVGSLIPWSGIHERGGTLRGKGKGLLIPLNTRGDRHIGRKAFKLIVARLLAQGNAFFRRVNGNVILFAKSIGDSQGSLLRFRRSGEAFDKFGGTKAKRGKSAADVPIAILLPSVTLRARLGLGQAVRNRYIRWIASAIQQRLNKLN